ncbi:MULTISPECIES: hypothetical protein [Pseudomonas]|uniref:hypothetical protein n=1 Tax=Pseudomonas TaxID=286 RepID=UPI000778AD42|nr:MULTISPECIES: hypothetical protein [Pseudomonas]KYC14161.1 hypothetical protein WM94_26825 [Pseudomonas sp. ABFPK]MBA6113722.1 hypothetical protein [Pseudomonas asiatica]MCE5988355.1 hypothetical protein [Pseudomonas sp. LM20]MCE5994978.1 hypothetical protein [Pseudomonas sp. KCA11]UMY59360.1 hypothetical protein MKK04_14105 [Pseudomonas sp. LS.1a]
MTVATAMGTKTIFGATPSMNTEIISSKNQNAQMPPKKRSVVIMELDSTRHFSLADVAWPSMAVASQLVEFIHLARGGKAHRRPCH